MIIDVLMACVVLRNMIIENEEGYNLKLIWQDHNLLQLNFFSHLKIFMNGTNAIKDVDVLDVEMTSLNTCGH